MKRIKWDKLIKIAAGCCLALLTAKLLGLNYSTSVVTITLLSIQNTRRETLLTALKRFCSFFAALIVAIPAFQLLRFSILSIGVYLLIFVFICQLLRIEEGLAMSTVLMLHFWSTGSVTFSGVLNEFILMSIGIAAGILMNSYMPRQVRAIRRDQQEIEERMRALFMELADRLLHDNHGKPDKELEKLGDLLKASLKRAAAHRDNSFSRDMDYYVRYMEMRLKQYHILERLAADLERLFGAPRQAYLIANFMRTVALSLHEYNNAGALLEELEQVRGVFRADELPVSREEFEDRAVLYEMVFALRRLLIAKRDFTASLTPTQIKLFWKPETPAMG